MFDGVKIIAIIPARGGSKGIKNKNIYPLNGRPLITYTIEAAKKSKYIDHILVSTDSDEIAETARENGADVPFMRPPELAGDTTKTVEVIVDVLFKIASRGLKYDAVVLLQPTSPCRTSEDIDGAIELFYKEDKKSLLSVSEVVENPVLIRRLEGNRAVPILPVTSTVRRQDFKKYYKVNGAIYINAVDEVDLNTSFNDNAIGYIINPAHAVDIDCMDDIKRAEILLNEQKL